MARANLSPFGLLTLYLVLVTSIILTVTAPVGAQEMQRDHPRDESVHGGHGGSGIGTGIGVGIGIANELIRRQGAPPDESMPHSKGKSVRHKTESKTHKRAAKKDDKTPPPKQHQTTDKPPPTKTTDNPSPPPNATGNPPPTQATGTPPAQPTGTPPPTKSNPPGANNPPTAANPQQPIAPPAQTAKEECPQRGRGCVALLIDFRKYAFVNGLNDVEEMDELGEAEELLLRTHCSVERISPDIKRTTSWTKKYTIGTQEHNIVIWTSQNDPDGTEAQHNKDEMEKITAAVVRHREKVRTSQPETAIEMVSGHGSGSGSPFGNWSAHSENAKNYLERGNFHIGNYDAAKHNVCGWFVYDSSCFSGNTAKAVDLLNNTGQANTFTFNKPSDSCPMHAGYEADVAVGTSTEDTCAYLVDGPRMLYNSVFLRLLETELDNRINEEQLRAVAAPPRVLERLLTDAPKTYRNNEGKKLIALPSLAVLIAKDAGEFPSRYSDNGYHYCGVPERKGMIYK